MRYLLLLLFIVSVSCKKEEQPKWDEPNLESKITAEPLKAVGDVKAAEIAAAYERLLAFTPTSPGAIDKLRTEKEVEDLIRELDTNYRKFELKPVAEFKRGGKSDDIIKMAAKNHGVNRSFYKYDIDGNGYTDLIAFGDDHSCMSSGKDGLSIPCNYSCVAVMGSATGNILKKVNARYFSDEVVPTIVPKRKGALIRMHDYKRIVWQNKMIKDTGTVILTYLKDAFVEHNPKPVFRGIEKIEYYTTFCFGTCPVFQLTLNKDKSAYFIAKEFNFYDDFDEVKEGEEGFFKGNITPEKYNEIEALLIYLDFEELEDYYGVSATDQATSTLRITYDNGQVKEIGDYGKEGTYGLKKVYELLADLRFNQKWQKTEEVYGVRIKTPYDL